MAKYQILYWHDIPVQIRVRGRGRANRLSKPLSERFQQAIDSAAMLAGLYGSDAYTAGFQWGEIQEREGEAQAVADAVAAELESQFAEIDWPGTAARLRAARKSNNHHQDDETN